mmetsp:Transcript_32735/g.77626  ORF Transcript_32735/g.77626 Transcript_32735/m.77626 type:complete len:242 (-) Transcript_32735:368-1093(-)
MISELLHRLLCSLLALDESFALGLLPVLHLHSADSGRRVIHDRVLHRRCHADDVDLILRLDQVVRGPLEHGLGPVRGVIGDADPAAVLRLLLPLRWHRHWRLSLRLAVWPGGRKLGLRNCKCLQAALPDDEDRAVQVMYAVVTDAAQADHRHEAPLEGPMAAAAKHSDVDVPRVGILDQGGSRTACTATGRQGVGVKSFQLEVVRLHNLGSLLQSLCCVLLRHTPLGLPLVRHSSDSAGCG